MAVDLLIQNVPEDLVARLQERAARSYHSLQGEILTILELAVTEKRRLTPREALAQVQALGLSTPSESVTWVREDRDAQRLPRLASEDLIDSLFGCLKDLPQDPLAELETEHKAEIETDGPWKRRRPPKSGCPSNSG